MFAPVIFSFNTYEIDCNSTVSEYAKALKKDPLVQAWFDAARTEKETIAICEAGAD